MDTTQIKFEHSPVESLADSFVSTPGTSYPPLFHDVNNEAMTPQSYDDDSMFGDDMNGSIEGTPAPEKKPVKKRKSWGQQLPEPKTNLPPRKRAKTEDEKEQRRVERVLRNRRAAQSSRERKRQEVEALEAEKHAIERQNEDLQMRLADAEARNAALQAELERIAGSNMTVFRGSPSSIHTPPRQTSRQASPSLTFSQELFGSSNDNTDIRSISTQLMEPQPQTVNPASLSPEIRAVAESANASSSDMTQHPAAVLCDLQCQSEEQRPWTNSAISQILATTFFLSMTSEAISSILSPLSQIMSCLRTGSRLSSTSSLLTLIIWLVTTTTTLMIPSSSTSTSTTTSSTRPRKFSLRMNLLRRLLACSPNLARPLMDATVSAMRLASDEQLSTGCPSAADVNRNGCTDSPSVATLMTLLWAIRVIEGERTRELEAPELDAATEVRQACVELDQMFRAREVSAEKAWYGQRRQKSTEGWSMAFLEKHG